MNKSQVMNLILEVVVIDRFRCICGLPYFNWKRQADDVDTLQIGMCGYPT